MLLPGCGVKLYDDCAKEGEEKVKIPRIASCEFTVWFSSSPYCTSDWCARGIIEYTCSILKKKTCPYHKQNTFQTSGEKEEYKLTVRHKRVPKKNIILGREIKKTERQRLK